jgi:hypothetical protein
MEDRTKSHVIAAERFQAARRERDRRADAHDEARGSAGEPSSLVDLRAAEDTFAAREAWLKWTERDDLR